MPRLVVLLLALCALIPSVLAGGEYLNHPPQGNLPAGVANDHLAPPSFCKCTCFSNSTIIPLSSHASSERSPPHLALRAPAATCAMCNRAFCIGQRLPICKNAEEKDVFTTCFQRDSRKDQIVVVTFIMVTGGLLGWSAVRKVLERRNSANNGGDNAQQGYATVGR
jgi:hypothetical protein